MTDKLSLSGAVVSFPRTSAERLLIALRSMRDGAYTKPEETSELAAIASQHDVYEWELLIECLEGQILD